MACPAPSAPPLPCSERHGSADPGCGEGLAASKAPFLAYGCAASSGAAAASAMASLIPAVKVVRGGGIWPGAVNPHSVSLSFSLSLAGQQRPCSRRSHKPWRAGPGTRGGRGPSLSARTGGRREAQRGDQTGRAPYHAASAPASSMQGLLFRNSLANPSKFAFTSSPALSA